MRSDGALDAVAVGADAYEALLPLAGRDSTGAAKSASCRV